MNNECSGNLLEPVPVAGVEGLPLGSAVNEVEGSALTRCVNKIGFGGKMTASQKLVAGHIHIS